MDGQRIHDWTEKNHAQCLPSKHQMMDEFVPALYVQEVIEVSALGAKPPDPRLNQIISNQITKFI